jgi:hypothetical protein
MQGLVDVGRMGCLSFAAHSADIHPSKDTDRLSEPLTAAFHPADPVSYEAFLRQNFKINYKCAAIWQPGTERVNMYHYRHYNIICNEPTVLPSWTG